MQAESALKLKGPCLDALLMPLFSQTLTLMQSEMDQHSLAGRFVAVAIGDADAQRCGHGAASEGKETSVVPGPPFWPGNTMSHAEMKPRGA